MRKEIFSRFSVMAVMFMAAVFLCRAIPAQAQTPDSVWIADNTTWDNLSGVAIANDGTIYVTDGVPGKLYSVDPGTGAENWSYSVGQA